MLKALIVLSLLAPDDKEAEQALETFKTAYNGASVPLRAKAVAELAKVEHEKILAKLTQVLMTEEKPVKVAAAKGLGGWKEFRPKVLAQLSAGLSVNAKEPDVLAAIYEAFGMLKDEAALGVVHRGFEEKDKNAAKAAVDAAAAIKSRNSIDSIMALMKESAKILGGGNPNNPAGVPSGGGVGAPGVNVPGGVGGGRDPRTEKARLLFDTTVGAMTKITKSKWRTYEEWEIWWKRNKATFKVAN